MVQRVGRLLLLRATVGVFVLIGLLAQPALPSLTSLPGTAQSRLLAADDPVPPPTTGGAGVTAMSVDFVDSLHGFAVNAIPALNDGGFAASPSLLLSTVDGGKNWKSQAIPSADGVVSAISFVSATTGWAASFVSPGGGPQYATVLATTNAGATWTAEALPDTAPGLIPFDIVFVDAQHGWLGG
jgi:photosystem II stability/assembly factor-like uncharacterized protein